MVENKVSDHAKILFIGINPHYGSFERGVPFSNNKMFWYLLNRAGLIHEDLHDLRDDRFLKCLYDTTFVSRYNLNFMNIIDRPTRDITELRRGEEEAGRQRILKTICENDPRIVCFVGKITYEKFIGRSSVEYGWQKPLCRSRVFVMHFPLRGKASVRIKELREVDDSSAMEIRS
jgi:double-stranded uracil-DNA glycosylase